MVPSLWLSQPLRHLGLRKLCGGLGVGRACVHRHPVYAQRVCFSIMDKELEGTTEITSYFMGEETARRVEVLARGHPVREAGLS